MSHRTQRQNVNDYLFASDKKYNKTTALHKELYKENMTRNYFSFLFALMGHTQGLFLWASGTIKGDEV